MTKLKSYALFDNSGLIVPGSLVVQKIKPSNKNFKEVFAVKSYDKTTSAYTSIVTAAYPNAILADTLSVKLETYLLSRGVKAKDTVLNLTACSDDVNAPEFANIINIGQTPESLNEFLGPFFGGGLAGYPHTGALGLQAWQSHATTDVSANGPLLLINFPHIGVSQQPDLVAASNNVGRMLRKGKSSASADNTCGAVVTAAAWVMANLAGGSAPVRGASVFANNDQFFVLATILWANRATLCSTTYNFILDATKYSAGVKLATEYIRAKSFTDLKDTLIPVLSGQKSLYFVTGTFINVDYSYSAFINFNELWLWDSGAWTDLTTAFKATL